MRKLLKLTAFLLILIVALASSCQPEEPKEIEYTILPESLNFEATGGEAGFTVSVKSPAIVESVEALSAWCQVSTNDISPVNVMVTVDPNTDGARNTSVVVNMKLGENKTSVTVPISQEGVWILINGIKWATRNVDMPGTFAARPEDAGMFYQWNRKIGWSTTDPRINSDGDDKWNSTIPTGDTWEKDNDPCPPGWRVPTRIELISLINVSNEWTTLNDVNGRIYGSGNNSMFLPAVGYRHSYGGLSSVNDFGYYWSSTYDVYGLAWFLPFNNNMTFNPNTSIRRYAYSVRCVVE
ncbi:MAG: hypothetical protein FWD09_03380 [Lentimicrobiaceae bacterium]|nr:hypothetical protein [Lentimicrobiaceae bacterium]